MNDLLLCKPGEIFLKGLNKHYFEERLVANVKRRLKPIGHFRVTYLQSALYIEAAADAAAVARLLSELGINVYWQTVVGDNRARLEQAVQLARTRADLIITTGGLGPTCDDLTKEVVAGAFGIPLELNKAEEERLRLPSRTCTTR